MSDLDHNLTDEVVERAALEEVRGPLINRIRKVMEEYHEYIPEQPDCGCGCWMAAGCSCSESWPCPDREVMGTLIEILEFHSPHECGPLSRECSIQFGGTCTKVGRCSHCGHETPCPTIQSIAASEMWITL